MRNREMISDAVVIPNEGEISMKFARLGSVCGDSAHFRQAALSATMIVPLLFMIVAFSPSAARAIDSARCDDDNVSEVPPFAKGRDASKCLLLDPGNGDPLVKFQYETYHKKGIAQGTPQNAGVQKVEIFPADSCKVGDSFNECSYILWDVTLDDYLDPGAGAGAPGAVDADDILSVYGKGVKYMLIKDSKIMNSWKCNGGIWSGPNNTRCTGTDSSAHDDGIQLRKVPIAGGWIVIQDTIVSNVGHLGILIQEVPDVGPTGGLVFQGMRFGQYNTALGESRTWINDCIARGVNPDNCREESAQIGYAAREIWIIDVWGNNLFSNFGTHQKVVVVNTGCNASGCSGTRGFNNGYPHPLSRGDASAAGPGVCPNGLIKQGAGAGVAATFCYTSIENALKDVVTATSNQGDCPAPYCPHKAPPFVHLSETGWATPPTGSTPARPYPPTLLD